MKIFVVYPLETDWDNCDGMAILAKNKERAIEIAEQEHSYFIDNIYKVEEIGTKEERIIHESFKWG